MYLYRALVDERIALACRAEGNKPHIFEFSLFHVGNAHLVLVAFHKSLGVNLYHAVVDQRDVISRAQRILFVASECNGTHRAAVKGFLLLEAAERQSEGLPDAHFVLVVETDDDVLVVDDGDVGFVSKQLLPPCQLFGRCRSRQQDCQHEEHADKSCMLAFDDVVEWFSHHLI